MTVAHPVSVEAQGLYKFFNPGQPTKVEYDGQTLRVFGDGVGSFANQQIDKVDLDLRWRHHALIMTLRSGKSIELSGFTEQDARMLHAAVSDGLRRHRETEAREREAQLQKQVRTITSDIQTLHAYLTTVVPKGRFVRKSHATSAAPRIRAVTSRCTPELVAKLNPDTSKLLADIVATESVVTDETRRDEANRRFVEAQAKLAGNAAVNLGYRALTQEQAEAVATDEDVTLVAAGAGTGKTTVITGKLAHLVTDQQVDPTHILVLAYNTNAAEEIRNRLPAALSGTDVATFHSFGLRVIGETTGTKPSVADEVGESLALRRTMQDFVTKMMVDDQLAQAILSFSANMPAEYLSPFDIETEGDYQQYVKNSELRTLKGKLVKSFEELIIANWLAANDVNYEYERQYEHLTANSRYRQYQPDFYLTDHGIYIEHFALNENDKAPPGWTGYEDGVVWKRQQHSRNETTLVETYSWQHREGILLSTLEEKLDELNVGRRQVPVQELVKELSQIQISRLADLLVHFLNHTKSSNISQAEIDRRAAALHDPRRADEFLKIWREARKRYDALLQDESRIDYHDMINDAAAIISSRQWNHPYTHVLIDEFQDISAGRMALAKALMRDGMAYFLVGDDWQSIYRFTGSQVRLFNEVHDYLGFTKRVNLTETFRFNDDIAQPSARFVQQNPDQTQRALTSVNPQGDGGLIVIADGDQRQGAKTALDHIMARSNPNDSTMILGRFRRSRENLPSWAQKHFSTVHGAKGREADYVVVLDLADDIYGFPCLREDDPLLDLVAPPVDDSPFPNAEERRLFYVGMTRGKKATYLVADPNRPSPFIRELLQIAPEVRELGQLSPSCPSCRGGHLVRSQSGNNLRCTNYPACRHMAPRCTACQAGYTLVNQNGATQAAETRCTNDACDHQEQVCPSCRRGILALRSNPRTDNRFWACSEWQGGAGCKFTKNAEHPDNE